MLTLSPRVARYRYAWQAVPCGTCNVTIGEPCDETVFGKGPHWRRVEYAELLGFRATDQHTLALLDPATREESRQLDAEDVHACAESALEALAVGEALEP